MDHPRSLTSLSQSLQRVERKNYNEDSESDTFSQFSEKSAFSFRSEYSKTEEDSVISYL